MCCGKNRAVAQAGSMSAARVSPTTSRVLAGPAETRTISVIFKYLEDGRASISGPASLRVYQFATTGARVRVEARDRPELRALLAVRWLRSARDWCR